MEERTFVRFTVKEAGTLMTPAPEWFFVETAAVNFARHLAGKGKQAKVYGVTPSGEQVPLGYYLPEGGNVYWLPYNPSDGCCAARLPLMSQAPWGYGESDEERAA
jgi:hypothetical protein